MEEVLALISKVKSAFEKGFYKKNQIVFVLIEVFWAIFDGIFLKKSINNLQIAKVLLKEVFKQHFEHFYSAFPEVFWWQK